MFVDFLMSIDLSGYRPNVFHSSTKDDLRALSKTQFEHYCDVLDGKDEVVDYKTLDEMWKFHNEIKEDFYYINCINVYRNCEYSCMTCNYNNKEIYSMFIINITNNIANLD